MVDLFALSTSDGRMEEFGARGPHFLSGAVLLSGASRLDCGFIPLLHSWFYYIFGSRTSFGSRSSLVRGLRLVILRSGWHFDGLPIWFTEITVRGIIFHFTARLLGS